MKINLSVDNREFQNQIKNLREKLNICLESGVLIGNLDEELNQLMEVEEKLLRDLIPYYRVYAKDIAKTSMEIKPIKEIGASNFDSFLQTSLRINDNLFLISSIDGRLQFFYIDHSKDSEINVEWSLPIKEIKESICFMHKLSEREILLFGFRGNCYLLLIDKLDEIPSIDTGIKTRKIPVNYNPTGFGKCIAINHNLIVVESGNVLNLLEIEKKKDQYHLTFHKNIYCTIPDWTTMGKIDNNYFAIATRSGEIYFIEYENRKFNIIDKRNILNEEIRQITCLEPEDGNKNSLIALGNKGKFKVFSLNGDIGLEADDLDGNLFDIQSRKGTGVILSEDGIVYLIEENFNNWSLNKEATIKNMFFTNILKLDISKYLLLGVEGKLNLLDIKRISTTKDLWNLPLY